MRFNLIDGTLELTYILRAPLDLDAGPSRNMSSHPCFSTPAQRSQGLMGTSSVQRQAGPTENNSFLGPPTGSFPGAGYGVPGPVMMTPLTGYPGLHPFHPIAPSHFISAPNVGTPVPVPQGQLLPQGQQGRTPQAQCKLRCSPLS